MKREQIKPRPNWKERCEEVGFIYHSRDDYWREDACYMFTLSEIDRIETATQTLHDMCLELVDDIIQKGDYDPYWLSPEACATVERSWNNDEQHLLGRFDLAYNGADIKLLEYNADTPTALIESAVVQWNWLQDNELPDQFNSLHEKIIARWKILSRQFPYGCRLYFTALRVESPEDECHIGYLMDTAVQAGIDVSSIDIEDIGWDNGILVDVKDEPILAMFKLYPWEFMMRDLVGNMDKPTCVFVEPAWKMLLSNKAILPLLWERHRDHPLLLPASFDAPSSGQWLRKPNLGREGENVTGVGFVVDPSPINSVYDDHYIYQKYFEIPKPDYHHTPVIGSWMVGDEPAGIGIREDLSIVTNNKSHFVPHYFE
jgi:glutathionylspermidine synthase